MSCDHAEPIIHTMYHADLAEARFQEEYWVYACNKRYPLLPHTSETRKRTRLSAPHLQDIPDHRLTHYTAMPVELPGDQIVRVYLKHTLKTLPGMPQRQYIDHVSIHVPPTREQLQAMTQAGTMPQQALGYGSTARALVLHQANVLQAEIALATVIYAHMIRDKAINALFDKLAEVLRQIGPLLGSASWEALLSLPTTEHRLEGNHSAPASHFPPITEITGPVIKAILHATQKDRRLHCDCACM